MVCLRRDPVRYAPTSNRKALIHDVADRGKHWDSAWKAALGKSRDGTFTAAFASQRTQGPTCRITRTFPLFVQYGRRR